MTCTNPSHLMTSNPPPPCPDCQEKKSIKVLGNSKPETEYPHDAPVSEFTSSESPEKCECGKPKCNDGTEDDGHDCTSLRCHGCSPKHLESETFYSKLLGAIGDGKITDKVVMVITEEDLFTKGKQSGILEAREATKLLICNAEHEHTDENCNTTKCRNLIIQAIETLL